MSKDVKEWFSGGRWSRGGGGSSFSKGFTLVELLVVIAIIGVLATLVLLQLGGARARARDTQRIAHINQLVNAMELHFEDNRGDYAEDIDDLGVYFSGGNVPKDPLSQENYGFAVDPAANPINSYQFWAELEADAQALGNDSDIDASSWGVAGAVGANDDECTKADTADCIYDRGLDQQ